MIVLLKKFDPRNYILKGGILFALIMNKPKFHLGVIMEGNIEKKEWEKPELVAIVRYRSEECVLSACKASASSRGCGRENGAPSFTIANS
jgi:hypothetical protein